MGGPSVPGGAGGSAGAFPWMGLGIAVLVLLAIAAIVVWGMVLSQGRGPRPPRERTGSKRMPPALAALITVGALAATGGLIWLVVDNIRSGGFSPGGGDSLEGYYVRTDLVDSSQGSAWYFEPATGTATYYAYWVPGTCDFSEPGSGPYSVEGSELVLASTFRASLSGDRRSFVLDAEGQWSGDDAGVAGPNMTVMNGISGKYVASSDC